MEGLLGLLLTQQEVRRQDPSCIILALDQHQDLLSGKGRLGDVVRLGLKDSVVRIAGTEGTVYRTANKAWISG